MTFNSVRVSIGKERAKQQLLTRVTFVLQAVLSASPVLCQDELKRFAVGVSPQWDTECDQLLFRAVSRLACRDEPRGHVVLILDRVGFIISAKYISQRD